MARLLPPARAFRDAFRGVRGMFLTELNARVHAAASAVVVVVGIVLGLTRAEWLAIVLTIALVFALEAVNTSIEAICDVVSPERHPGIGRAKDLAAGAVLIAAAASVIVAAMIFGPRLFSLSSGL